DIAGCRDDAALAAADDDRAVAQFRPVTLFHRRIERVAVDMRQAQRVEFVMPCQPRTATGVATRPRTALECKAITAKTMPGNVDKCWHWCERIMNERNHSRSMARQQAAPREHEMAIVTGPDPITIQPVTPACWPLFEDLFGKQGACYGCWCTHFRLPPAVRRENNRQRNKDHMRERVMAGPPPGLLAFNGKIAQGWAQIGPRAGVPAGHSTGRGRAPLAA